MTSLGSSRSAERKALRDSITAIEEHLSCAAQEMIRGRYNTVVSGLIAENGYCY